MIAPDCIVCGKPLPMTRRNDTRGGKAITYMTLAASVKTDNRTGRPVHGKCAYDR